MLPAIGNQTNKKKNHLPGTDQLIKEWVDTRKQLEVKAKSAANKITSSALSDYNKICKLKEIPDFYSNYLLYFAQKLPEARVTELFSAEIRQIINHRSYYHKISDALDQRAIAITQTQNLLEINQGFLAMNSGKPVKGNIRAKINQLLKSSTSLQQIKQIQTLQIQELAKAIIKLRHNTSQILEIVKQWRHFLHDLVGNSTKKSKIKIIFPSPNFNCLLLPLYDQSSILSSFLSKELSMPQQNNPFLLVGKEPKRKNQFQQIFKNQLSKDTTSYDILAQQILAQQIKKKDPDALAKEQQQKIRQRQEQKIKKLKQIKQKQQEKQKQKEKLRQQRKRKQSALKQSLTKQGGQKQEKNSLVKKSKSLIDIEGILFRHNKKRNKLKQPSNESQLKSEPNINQFAGNNITLVQSPVQKKEKKIKVIYGNIKNNKQQNGQVNKEDKSNNKIKSILDQKAHLEQQLKQAKLKNKQFQKLIKKMERGTPPLQTNEKKDEKQKQKGKDENKINIQKDGNTFEGKSQFQNKIESVYKSRHAKKPSKLSRNDNSAASIEQLLNDKRSLQKELKEQIRQKNKIQKLLKKSEGKIQKQIQANNAQKIKLQQKILQLSSSKVKQQQIENNNQGNLKKSHAKSVISIYTNGENPDKTSNPQVSLFQSKLTEQKQHRLSLQRQIKDLIKQKTKLEKVIERSESIVSKQKEQYQRKIQKFQITINKLKQNNDRFKSLNNSIVIENSRKKSESLRMYTTTPMKNQKQATKNNNQLKKSSKHIQSANYFKLPPEIKIPKLKQPTITEKDEQEQKKNTKQVIFTKQLNKVEIIQTKKTIQIIYQGASRNKLKKQKQPKEKKENESLNKQIKNQQFEKIKKDKQSLLYRLQRQQLRKQKQQKAQQRKAIKQEGQIQRYKDVIERERQKKYELQNKIKNLRKQLYDQFDQRLKNQKMKFQQEKRELLAMIQNEKGQKQLKQKYLNNQIKFLKEMQSNQNQLIKLLQMEKKNRIQKEKELAAEIAKKQQLLQIIQIQQIKKGLQTEIRKELENEDQQSEDLNIEQKKDQLKQQIQQMTNERNAQLQEIDEQNQKLKALITRIKDEESKLISAIKENIQSEESNQDQDQEQIEKQFIREPKNDLQQDGYISQTQFLMSQQKVQKNQEKLKRSKLSVESAKKQQVEQQIKYNNQQTEKIFKSRLRAQEQHELKMKTDFKNIRESPEYRSKQEVQNLIEMYLQNPHEYPPPKKRDYSPQQKLQIKQQVLNKSKLASDFQRELLQLKQVQTFVPTSDDDMMTSHLLSLKRVYENQQSSALKQQLFPSIQADENYHHSELSFQSQQTPPPKTLRDHVELHAKNFKMKKNNNKNFLAVNKMRVAMLQQNRKQKEKHFIEQQAKRRAQQQVLKKHFRAMQQQRYRKSLQKKKMQQEKLQSMEKNKQKRKKKVTNNNKSNVKQNKQLQNKVINKQQVPDLDQKQKQQQMIGKQKSQQINKQQNEQVKQKQKQKIDQRNNEEQEQQYEQQYDQQEQKNEEELDKPQKDEQDLKDIDTENIEVTNNHTSLDRQKKQLQSDVYQFQDEIRSYISHEERFDIYQQFVQSNEVNNYIQNIINISSQEIKGLNNNSTILKDIPTYKSILILIAKDKVKNMEVGIGIFHKEEKDSLYICDYVLAHNMRHFLNLLFNFSRYIFKLDVYTNKIQFFFDLNKLEDQISVIHFIEFQQKCKRLGQVYVKVGADKTRKYVLRRNLFEPTDKQFEAQTSGIQFNVSLEVHSDYIKQRGIGFKNTKKIQYFSTTALLSVLLKKNEQMLQIFRKNAEDDLKYRELLVTALLFQKNEVDVKNCSTKEFSVQQRLEISKKLHNQFVIEDPTHQVQQLNFNITNLMPSKTKRCTQQVEAEQINYIIHSPEEAVTKIQASNSSQMGIFLSIVPKYKIFIIEASQFIEMNKINPEINAFFYIKHFIKNISEVTKEEHPRIFIPEVSEQNQVFLSDLSEKMKAAIFAREKIQFGWKNQFSNSIVFTPFHKDLVIKKPFIISLLSATIERVVQGTPLCATVVI